MRRLLILLFLTVSIIDTKASHVRGGEITYECLKSGSNEGKFIFTVKMYNDCAPNSTILPTTFTLFNPLYATYGGVSNILVTQIATPTAVTPRCDSGANQINCGQLPPLPTIGMAIKEHVYKSAPVQINGTPHPSGSAFWLSICCRPTSVNISGSPGYYFRVVMYPYVDPVSGFTKSLGNSATGANCFDSSPVFTETLPSLGVSDKTNYFTLKSYDRDCDSMYYELSAPLINATTGVSWSTGYSVANPLPSTFQNSLNVSLSLNGRTGNASFKTMGGAGFYAMAQKVTAYKYGQRVSEVFRDYPLYMGTAGGDAYTLTNQNPTLEMKKAYSLNYTSDIIDTFDIGESVHINLRAMDFDLIGPGLGQSVSLRLVSDPAISGTFNPYGCTSSSCAYLDTNNAAWNGSEFKMQSILNVDFKWDITCDALDKCENGASFWDNSPFGPSSEYETYSFTVAAEDNLCPLPLNQFRTITITVRDTAKREALLKKIAYNGTAVDLSWSKFQGANFQNYTIYRADSLYGNFIPIATLTNINDTNYTDMTASTSHLQFYRVTADSNASCFKERNTAASIFLHVNDTVNYSSVLTWNNQVVGFGRSAATFMIEIDSGSGWQVLDSIYNFYSPVLTYVDSKTTCQPSNKYRITLYDPWNDMSYISNVDSSNFTYPVNQHSIEICDGDSLLINGEYRKSAGTYMDTLSTFQGCDSIVQISLSLLPINNTNLSQSICGGDSVLIDGIYRTASGNYYEFYQNNKGCDSNLVITLNVIYPLTSVSSNGRILTSNALNVKYQWMKCDPDSIMTADTNQNLTPTSNGSYAVIVTQGSCSDTSDCYEIQSLGIRENGKIDDLLYFPNPVDDEISFVLKSNEAFSGKFFIYDGLGKIIEHQEVQGPILKINTSSFSDGIHHFKFQANNGVLHSGRFIVHH